MARLQILSFLSLSFASAALAQDDVHITELPLFSLLAPCAQSALSYNVMGQSSSCGENNNLQSCVCTKDNNYAAIGTSISRSMSYSCGETATEDLSSVSIVYSAYCTPTKSFTLQTPTTNLITDLVTDIPEFFNLARCAQSALSYAAIGYMSSNCPPDPVAAYAGCICTRNKNHAEIDRVISSSASWSCDGNVEDITSAQKFFSAYCDMGNGTTNLPLPSPPPGDMTYYIEALPQYTPLVPCAQSALSGVINAFTNSYCPEGPEALASCVCIKSGMFRTASIQLTSSVKYSCESTALEDVTSAVAVLDQYCSAARGEVTATGLTSAEQTYAAATGRTIATPSGPAATGTNSQGGNGNSDGSGNGDGSNSGNGGSSNSSSSGGTNIPAIAGGAAAGAGAVLIIVLIAWLIIRRRKKAAAAAAATEGASATAHNPLGPGSPPAVVGHPELGGQPISAPPYSPAPGSFKEGTIRTDTVSPVSPYAGHPPPPPMASELHGQGGIRPYEMHGTQQWGPPGHTPGQQYGQSLPLPPELQGHQPQHPQYAPPHGQPVYQMPQGQPHPGYGGGWQQSHYSELESGQQGPHAR